MTAEFLWHCLEMVAEFLQHRSDGHRISAAPVRDDCRVSVAPVRGGWRISVATVREGHRISVAPVREGHRISAAPVRELATEFLWQWLDMTTEFLLHCLDMVAEFLQHQSEIATLNFYCITQRGGERERESHWLDQNRQVTLSSPFWPMPSALYSIESDFCSFSLNSPSFWKNCFIPSRLQFIQSKYTWRHYLNQFWKNKIIWKAKISLYMKCDKDQGIFYNCRDRKKGVRVYQWKADLFV